MKLKYILCAWSALLLGLSSCTKDALDKKTDLSLTVASTLDDYQQLLDGIEGGVISNTAGFFSYRSLGDYMSDDLVFTDASYNSYFKSNPFITSLYKWDKNLFSTVSASTEWNNAYKIVLNANVALDGIEKVKLNGGSDQVIYNNIKGTALFMRAVTFYDLAQFWAPAYKPASADLGIVLRLSSDPNVVSVRSTVSQTYSQITTDLVAAADLLPNTSGQNTQLSKIRPSKAAAYGMLARVYLAMGDYQNVIKYTTAALQLYSSLLDYSALNTSPTFRFFNVPNFHSEILYYSMDMSGTVGGTFGYWNPSSELYNLYTTDNDLRKQFFFNTVSGLGILPSADYSGTDGRRFNGIAVDELYLSRAEAYARTANRGSALSDLNTLLVKRWKAGTFVPYTADTDESALTQILTERRKELVIRGVRWTDLKRLNPDPRFAKTISRSLLGVTYTLPANDSRYTLQIPDYIIAASGGSIVQNP